MGLSLSKAAIWRIVDFKRKVEKYLRKLQSKKLNAWFWFFVFDKNNSFQFSAKKPPTNLVSTTIAWFLVEKKPKIWNSGYPSKDFQENNTIPKPKVWVPNSHIIFYCPGMHELFQKFDTFFSKTSTPILIYWPLPPTTRTTSLFPCNLLWNLAQAATC